MQKLQCFQTLVFLISRVWVVVPDMTLVSNTLNHGFVFRMGCKAVGPVCCEMHEKEPSALIKKRKGFVSLFLVVAAECTRNSYKVLHTL